MPFNTLTKDKMNKICIFNKYSAQLQLQPDALKAIKGYFPDR